jgi:MFS family permease
VWGVGTGFQQFGRPLFVASLGVQVFLVTMIGAMNSTASLFAAPLTGFLTDRFGRRPIMMIGNCLRGIASGLQCQMLGLVW